MTYSSVPDDASSVRSHAGDDGEVTVLDDLADEGMARIQKEVSALDPVWFELVSGSVARAIADRAFPQLARAQRQLRQLIASAEHAVGVLQETESDLAEMTSSVLQLQALLYVADAGADLTYPRVVAASHGAGSVVARVLEVLNRKGEIAAKDLTTLLNVHAAQTSRACSELARHGLIERRQYGRQVRWLITTAGRDAAGSLEAGAVDRALDSSNDVLASRAHASTATDFDEAVRNGVAVLEVEGRRRDGEWRATYLRVARVKPAEGKRVLQSGHAPDVLLDADGAAAYVSASLEPELAAVAGGRELFEAIR